MTYLTRFASWLQSIRRKWLSAGPMLGVFANAAIVIWMPIQLLALDVEPRTDDDDAEQLELTLSRASAVALVEITGIEEVDSRPMDGNLSVQASYRVIESSGDVPEIIYMVKAWGGHWPSPERPELPSRLRHDSLEVGERHWFVFGNDADATLYPYGVVGWWREESDSTAPQLIKKALNDDRFDWHPRFSPETGVVFGYRVQEEVSTWTLRVEKDGMQLWEANIAGVPENPTYAMFAYPGAIHDMVADPSIPVEQILVTESIRELGEGNSHGHEPGDYRIREAYDINTGALRADWTTPANVGYTLFQFRQFDRETSKLWIVYEQYYILQHGLELGGEKEEFLFRIEKRLNSAGEIVLTRYYRYGSVLDEDGIRLHNGYVEIDQETIDEVGLDRILDAKQ